MVTEGDCSCTDSTEPSNVTSLRSDDVTSARNPDANLCRKATDKGNDVVEESKDKHKHSPNASPGTNYHATEVAKSLPTKSDRQSQQNSSKNPHPTTTTLQFPPSFPCLCHTHKINGYVLPVKLQEEQPQSRPFWSRFKWKQPKNVYCGKENKMYEIKLKQTQCSHYAKVRASSACKQQPDPTREFQSFVCCDISDGIPSKNDKSYDLLDKSKLPKHQMKTRPKKEEAVEKIEIYYFDHGNSAYYQTTDCHPVLTTDKCAEKTDQAATRFWAEIFGTIHIGTAFIMAFILQLLRFLLYSVIRPLTVGILQLIADYFVKPLLSIVFNALIQPILILFYNIAMSLRDLCQPIAEALGLFLREIANLCAAIRLVEVKHVHTPTVAST
ncbi:uncharacterized protein LOC105181454 [Harpegnathos saltator]|uniref:Uncharacterized protein n=1 Tax=Harpegnathos saltator TaxID=610380 RepID=E2B3D9_HARSA|nr:uncharacterized protein LOC105181454 [Harpegnathos saltator]EFN89817.1 hypothetical protein EAI_14007 [Harpegnathos saltator]